MFANFELYFNFLKLFGPGRGYDPEPYRSVLIVHPDNIEAGKGFGLRHGFKVCTGALYLGGSIGDEGSKRD